jgi:hypothetical protein
MTRNHCGTEWGGPGAQNRTLNMFLLAAVFTQVNSNSLWLGCWVQSRRVRKAQGGGADAAGHKCSRAQLQQHFSTQWLLHVRHFRTTFSQLQFHFFGAAHPEKKYHYRRTSNYSSTLIIHTVLLTGKLSYTTCMWPLMIHTSLPYGCKSSHSQTAYCSYIHMQKETMTAQDRSNLWYHGNDNISTYSHAQLISWLHIHTLLLIWNRVSNARFLGTARITTGPTVNGPDNNS